MTDKIMNLRALVEKTSDADVLSEMILTGSFGRFAPMSASLSTCCPPAD